MYRKKYCDLSFYNKRKILLPLANVFVAVPGVLCRHMVTSYWWILDDHNTVAVLTL